MHTRPLSRPRSHGYVCAGRRVCGPRLTAEGRSCLSCSASARVAPEDTTMPASGWFTELGSVENIPTGSLGVRVIDGGITRNWLGKRHSHLRLALSKMLEEMRCVVRILNVHQSQPTPRLRHLSPTSMPIKVSLRKGSHSSQRHGLRPCLPLTSHVGIRILNLGSSAYEEGV